MILRNLALAAALGAGLALFAAQPASATKVQIDPTANTVTCSGCGGAGVVTAHSTLSATQCADLSTVCGLWTSRSGTLWTTPASSAGVEYDMSASTNGLAAPGGALPTNRNVTGVSASGVTADLIACDKSAIYDASTSGDTQLVAASGSTAIYVCGYTMFTPGTVNVNLDSADTGGGCANPVKITPAFQLTAQSGAVDGSPFYRGLKTPAGKALCWKASGAVAGQGIVYYTQF